MAAITAVGTALASTTNASSYATASFTPTAGRLTFAWVCVSDATPSAPTLTDSANGLTFTQVGRAHKINTSNSTQEGELYLFVANQATPGSPVASVWTISGVTGASGGIIMPGEVAGLSKVGTAAVRQFAVVSDVQGGTAPSVVFAANALTGNPIAYAAQVSVGTGSTPPTGMTERADVNYSTPTTGAEWASRDSGFTGTTLALGGTGNGPCCAIAVEFDTSSSAFTGTAPLSGDGSLGGTGTPTEADVAALSGSGSLAVAGTPAVATTVALSGTGSLTAAETPAVGGTTALAGSGTLNAATTPAVPGTAALAGTGSLAAGGTPAVPGTATLAGTGTLAAVGTKSNAGVATLAGTGTLTASGSPKAAGTATLAGDGTLTTTGTPAGRDVAALSGDGTLTTAVVPGAQGTPALSGTGTLVATGVAHISFPHVEFLGYAEAPDRTITYAEAELVATSEHTTDVAYQEVST